jgi:glycosyltransferase involved in cell wall biosynthesis
VVNDGSSDRSADIVKRYLTSGYIRYIEQANQGVANARNTAIGRSSGDFVAFVDQDDLWLPDKLEKQVAYMESHTDVALVHARVECIDKHGVPISCDGRVYVDNASGHCAEQLLIGNRIAVLTALVRRSCLTGVGLLSQTYAPSDDWHLWLRLAVRFPFGFLDEVVAQYRVHDFNESRDLLKMKFAEIRVAESFRAEYPLHARSMDQRAIDTTLIRCYEGAAALLSQAGRTLEAKSLKRKAARIRLSAPWYYADLLASFFPQKVQRHVLWYCRRLGEVVHLHRRQSRTVHKSR